MYAEKNRARHRRVPRNREGRRCKVCQERLQCGHKLRPPGGPPSPDQKRRSSPSRFPAWLTAGDMGDMDVLQVSSLDQAAKQFGGVDVLVNNAGISYIGLLQDMSCEDWERMLHVNLTSVFNCCKLAIPYMVQQKQGKIVNISSVWGTVGASCEAAYSATKGGINALTKAHWQRSWPPATSRSTPWPAAPSTRR